MATRGGSFCKRLLLNLPDHKTHDGVSTLADTFYRRARTSDVLLSRLGEREGGITLSVQVGSPPSGNFMASGFSVSLLLVPPRFSVPLSGGRERMVVYPVAGLFLVALARRYRRPFQDRRLYITLIRSLSMFCHPADVLSHALGVFVNLSRLLTTAARASGRVIFCEK